MAFTLEELYNMQNGDQAPKPKAQDERQPVSEESAAPKSAEPATESLSAAELTQVRELEAQLQEVLIERDVLRERLPRNPECA